MNLEVIVLTSSKPNFKCSSNIRLLYYNEADTYGDRIRACLRQIKAEWILLTHEIDVPLTVDFDFISGMLDCVKAMGGRRFNLQVMQGGTSIFSGNARSINAEFLDQALRWTVFVRQRAGKDN